MLYGQFLYGWSDYQTADFTEELAVSLTNSSSSFSAGVTKVMQAIFTSNGQSDFDGDIIRVRLAISQVDSVSSTQSAAGLILDGNSSGTTNSSLSLNGERVRLADMDMSAQSSITCQGVRIFNLNYLSIPSSAANGTANFLSNISASIDSQSELDLLANCSYSAGADYLADANVTANVNLLYNGIQKDNEFYQAQEAIGSYSDISKDNETYTDINNGSDAYIVTPRQNESYEVING